MLRILTMFCKMSCSTTLHSVCVTKQRIGGHEVLTSKYFIDILSARGIIPAGTKPRPRHSHLADGQASGAGSSSTTRTSKVKSEADMAPKSPQNKKRPAEVVDLTLSSSEEENLEGVSAKREVSLTCSEIVDPTLIHDFDSGEGQETSEAGNFGI